MLALAVIMLIFLSIAKNDFQKDIMGIIDLTNKSFIRKWILPITPYVLFASVFFIPLNYFFIFAILLVGSLLIPVFFQNNLIVKTRGIRHVFRWKAWDVKWDDMDMYELDKEHGTLIIHLKNGQTKQVTGIKSDYYAMIETNIDKYSSEEAAEEEE
jgi:hypothetical protein